MISLSTYEKTFMLKLQTDGEIHLAQSKNFLKIKKNVQDLYVLMSNLILEPRIKQ